MLPSWIRSRNCRPRLVYFLAIEITSRRFASTISFLAWRASRSPFCTTALSGADPLHQRRTLFVRGTASVELQRLHRVGAHPDFRHHATVLVLKNMAVIHELTGLRERDLKHDRPRAALAGTPLCDRAITVLAIFDVRDIRDSKRYRDIIFQDHRHAWASHRHARAGHRHLRQRGCIQHPEFSLVNM